MSEQKCIICGRQLDSKDDNQICDECEETRNELTNGKGEDDE